MSLKAHPFSSRSLQIVAQILADTIQHHDGDGHLPCPLLLAISCNFLLYRPDMRKQRMRQIRTQHPDLIRVLLRFLMRPRTVEERANLATIPAPESGECPCARNNYGDNRFLRELHDEEGMVELTGAGTSIAGRSALQIILYDASDCLHLIINFAFFNHPVRKVMLRCHSQGVWPLVLDDVFPYGVAASITSLCDWAVYAPRDSQIFKLAGALQRTFLKEPFFGHFARSIISRAVLPSLTAKLRLLDDDADGAADAVNDTEIRMGISCIGYEALNDFIYLHNRQLRAAMIDDLDSLSHLGRLCLDAYHQMDKTVLQPTDWHRQVQLLFLECHVRLRLLFNLPIAAGTPRLPNAILQRIKEKTSTNRVQQLVEFEVFRELPICANPGCAHTPLSLGSPLAICSGCRYVSYCSRECQRAAWRHARFPHRDVCPKFVSLMHAALLSAQQMAIRGSDATSAAFDNEAAEQVLSYLEAIYLGPESIA